MSDIKLIRKHWRYRLDPKKRSRCHIFCLKESCKKKSLQNWKNSEKSMPLFIYSLAHTKLLDFVMDKIPYSWIRSGYHYHTAIFPSQTGVFLNAKLRDEVLSDFTITVSEDIKVPETSFLWCNDADFTYKGIRFRWKDNDDVCRIEGDNEVYTFSANKEMYDKDLYLGKMEVFEQLDQIVNSVIAQK